MSNVSSYDAAVSRLASQSEAVGRLAQDSGAFAAVVASFESKDPNAFRWVLERLEMLPYCELICEWVRIKLCALRCAEICRPIPESAEIPNFQRFAQAVVKLASNEKLLRRVVDAVSCGDASEYHAAIDELKLGDFCQLICHWVCSIGYRRVCEIVCGPKQVVAIDAASELRAAGQAIANFVKNEKAFDAIGRAAVDPNCEILQSAINRAGFQSGCEIICRLVCVWRYVWVCRELCELPPRVLTGVYAVEEAQQFALATRQLANQPRVVGDLVTAVQNRDAKAYQAIIERFRLGPYCWQVCAWVGSVSCHEFCTCVCPPLGSYFTAIGALLYESQIDSSLPATGLTISNPPQAFFGTLRLNGALQQELGGLPLEYSFWYQPITKVSTTLSSNIGAGDNSITVASSSGFPPSGSFNIVIGSSSGGYEIITVTKVVGTTWTVTRGQQGTAAAPAAAGATIVGGVAAAGPWTQIPQGWITRSVIGQQITGVLPHLNVRDVAVNPNPGDVPASFTADGWIQVSQGADIYLNGDLIYLDSTQLPGFTNSNENAVSAGNAAIPGAPTDLYFGLQMLVRQQGSAATTPAGTCSVLAVDNNLYSNINHHPEWGKWVGNNQYGVAMVDIKELQSAGCAGITDSLTVLFTASAPNLGSVALTMVGDGVSYNFNLPAPIPQTGNWYGTAGNPFTISDLPACAYLITLSVSLLLTNGDSGYPVLSDQIAFCLS
jgi:hypothetical protein